MPETTTEIPKGFRVESDESGNETISYKTTGMGCLLWFLVILQLGIGGCFAFIGYHEPAGMLKVFNARGAWFCFGCGFVAMIYFTSVLMFHLFGSTVFVVHPTKLTVRKRLFGLSSAKSIDRNKMEYYEQIKDGGGGDDSFPSWGLNLWAGRRIKLLARQPIEKGDWLGPKLAQFFGIQYRRCLNRE